MKTKIFFGHLAAVVLSLLLFACSGGTTADNQANKNSANAVGGNSNGERTANPSSNANANIEKPAETGFVLPETKPIENGKTHTVGGITVTVPADWKKVDQKEGWAKFQSPDKIELGVGRSYDMVKGDLLSEFVRIKKENPNYKAMTRAIDGELGILLLNEKSSVMNADILSWETFPPPDAKGYAVRRYVQLYCPAGAYEQNKQKMFDVLFSTKLQR
jgi:hypothetical protein